MPRPKPGKRKIAELDDEQLNELLLNALEESIEPQAEFIYSENKISKDQFIEGYYKRKERKKAFKKFLNQTMKNQGVT